MNNDLEKDEATLEKEVADYRKKANIQKGIFISMCILVPLFILLIFTYNKNSSCVLIEEEFYDSIPGFNAPFLNYQGAVNGSTARNLVQVVNRHNISHADEPNYQVRINANDDGGDVTADVGVSTTEVYVGNGAPITYKAGDIQSTKRYRVKLDYVDGDVNNYICNINIEEI